MLSNVHSVKTLFLCFVLSAWYLSKIFAQFCALFFYDTVDNGIFCTKLSLTFLQCMLGLLQALITCCLWNISYNWMSELIQLLADWHCPRELIFSCARRTDQGYARCSRNISMKFPSFCMTTFSASLTISTVLLQSHDWS
jgi:hypothetical protein